MDKMKRFKKDADWSAACIVNAIKSIVKWACLPSLAEIKITDFFGLFRTGNRISFSYGRSADDKAILNATNAAINRVSSRLPRIRHIIYNVTGSEKNLNMLEIQESVNELLSWCNDNTKILLGIRINNRLKDTVKVDIWLA